MQWVKVSSGCWGRSEAHPCSEDSHGLQSEKGREGGVEPCAVAHAAITRLPACRSRACMMGHCGHMDPRLASVLSSVM
jgi:hypothetical protein